MAQTAVSPVQSVTGDRVFIPPAQRLRIQYAETVGKELTPKLLPWAEFVTPAPCVHRKARVRSLHAHQQRTPHVESVPAVSSCTLTLGAVSVRYVRSAHKTELSYTGLSVQRQGYHLTCSAHQVCVNVLMAMLQGLLFIIFRSYFIVVYHEALNLQECNSQNCQQDEWHLLYA